MGEGMLLVVIFGTLHLFGMGFAALMLLPLMRDEQPQLWLPPQEDDDGGGNDRIGAGGPLSPRDPSPGGLPLPDAVPARVRLRGPGRLSELTPLRERRPAHVPAPTPQRERERT